MRSITKNVSYTFLSNIVGLLVSTILVIIVPRFISIEKYGFWQLYIFYSSYTNYLSFGLTDGIYLRIAGKTYGSINKENLKGQFLLLVFVNLCITFFYYILLILLFGYSTKRIILFASLISAVIVVPRSLFTFVLQATNRIKEYSIIVLMERTLYFIFVIFILVSGIRSVAFLILADILAKIFTCFYIFFICKDIFIAKTVGLKNIVIDGIENLSVGSKLLIANLSSMLIIGVLRFSIEKIWDISTFGKVSLTLSISNMLMIFINSVGIVLLPVIKNMNKNKMSAVYSNLRILLTAFLFMLMIFYFPMSELIKLILPKYSESVMFIALLFPMCIFEGKMAMLINTYMKALRLENMLMTFNILSVLLSCFLSLVFGFWLKSLNLTVLSIVLALAFKCLLSEKYLTVKLSIKINFQLLIDLLLTSFFIIVAWYLPIVVGMLIYVAIVFLYLCIFKGRIYDAFRYFQKHNS